MKLAEFDYRLPKELIAQEPVFPKDHSKLMIVPDKIEHRHFYDLIDYLDKDDVLVINETKVKRCKLVGKKATGAPCEIFIVSKENDAQDIYKVRIKTKNPIIGQNLAFSEIRGKIIDTEGELFLVRFEGGIDKELERSGEFPIPTYIKRDSLSDKEYQTVYAQNKGSMAAPTAGLHFTEELLEKIKKKGVKIAKVCLHIDFGTFFGITAEHIEDHKMHEEWCGITEENACIINGCKGKLVAVGTTSVRTLEACYEDGKIVPKRGRTDIYIYPGYKFKSNITAMITNFHLPKSSLLLLVSAFAGKENVLNAYKEAVKEKYRFYSLGDAMLLFRQ